MVWFIWLLLSGDGVWGHPIDEAAPCVQAKRYNVCVRDYYVEGRLLHMCGEHVMRRKRWHKKYAINKTIAFIDGLNTQQVLWALGLCDALIIVVRGYPLRLREKYGRVFYVDYDARLQNIFDLKGIPARVTLDGQECCIEELCCLDC